MSDLLISVGDYVIVQDGIIDEPKIVVWDDLTAADVVADIRLSLLRLEAFDTVTVAESVTIVMNVIQLNVSETILVEDSPAVQPAVLTVALSVFDTVLVREGQSDDLSIVILEDVTVTESVGLAMTLLRVSVFDNVTVVDQPAVLLNPISSVGMSVQDTITVQEALTLFLTVYINVFDAIAVVDGALNMDVFDAITVTEDVTVKLARLVIDVNEPITVTESVTVFGPAIDVGFSVFDDVVLTEAVTVFLTRLVPEVFEDVAVTESVAVTVSSIDLTMNVSETVTVADALEIQLNPMQINEFTEIIVTEFVDIYMTVLNIAAHEDVTVVDMLMMQLLPIQLPVNDTVTVTERVALRIGLGGRKRQDLTVLGAGE